MTASRILALALLATAAPALATPLEDRLREQLQSTVTQLRELQNGKAALEAAKAAAEKERDALKAKGSVSPVATRELAAAKSANAVLNARAGAAATELAAANARTADLAAKLQAAQTELGQQRAAAAASSATATATATSLQACTDRNARLVATGRDLVKLHQKRYGHGNFPPLQLLRTRIEAEAQAMGDKVAADAIVVNPGQGAPK